MTPAGGANAPALAPAAAVDRILQDGEEIILVVRPSMWQIVLVSMPTLLLAGLVALGVFAAEGFGVWIEDSTRSVVLLACAAVAALRLALMSIRWIGRLYVLTNRRVVRLGGAVATSVADCPLSRISDVAVVSATAERMFGLGSLLFTIDGRLSTELGWMNLAHPEQVADEVRRAIARNRNERG